MKSKFINVLMFAAGAAIGSLVTYKVVKNQYEKIVQEEIDSIKEAFTGMDVNVEQEQIEDTDDEDEGRPKTPGRINWDELEDLDEDEEDDEYAPTEKDIKEYESLTHSYSGEKGGAETVKKEPYVISPYDFGELDEFSQIELTYYADGTLEDDEYNIITNPDELLGPKALFTFGEYEDDSVFVRNEYLRTDFQVLKDYRTYEEARTANPRRVDDE